MEAYLRQRLIALFAKASAASSLINYSVTLLSSSSFCRLTQNFLSNLLDFLQYARPTPSSLRRCRLGWQDDEGGQSPHRKASLRLLPPKGNPLLHLAQVLPFPRVPIAYIQQQHYTAYQSHLVSDPNSSLRTGDVVRIAARPPASKHIRHVVTDIIAPWGPPAAERPPIPSLEDLDAQYRAKRDARVARRTQKAEAPRADRTGAQDVEKGPSLKERHTDVIGGVEVVGGEEKVVLERNKGDL